MFHTPERIGSLVRFSVLLCFILVSVGSLCFFCVLNSASPQGWAQMYVKEKLEAAGRNGPARILLEAGRPRLAPRAPALARRRAPATTSNSCSQACFCHCSFCSPHRPACCCLCSWCSHRPARTSPRPNRHSRCRSYAGDGSTRVAWCTARRAASRRRRLCPQPRRVLSSARFPSRLLRTQT